MLQVKAVAAVLVVLFCGWSIGCQTSRPADGGPTAGELVVLRPEMALTAENENGKVSVTAGRGTWRTYQFDGGAYKVKLWERSGTWSGLTGIYTPGNRFARSSVGPDREVRIVAQEGQLHVGDISEALSWMAEVPAMKWVCTNSGLVVGYSATPGRWQVNVDVVQIYVNGEKPTTVPGASDASIQVANN